MPGSGGGLFLPDHVLLRWLYFKEASGISNIQGRKEFSSPDLLVSALGHGRSRLQDPKELRQAQCEKFADAFHKG
jgi:hypothetical protein